MDLGWDDRLWTIAGPLIIVAIGIVSRTLVNLALTWKAAKWWNEVVRNTHDAFHDDFEREQRELDARQGAALAALSSSTVRTKGDPAISYIALELTRMRQRLEVMRIEDHARYGASSARSQFSDLEIVWLWLRHRGNPKAKLDQGTKRRFMASASQTPSVGPAGEVGAAPPNSPGAGNETPIQRAQPTSAQAPQPHATAPQVPSVMVLSAPTMLITEQLERLTALRERGVLTPEEFAKLKAVLLDF